MYNWVSAAYSRILDENETSNLWNLMKSYAQIASVGENHRAPLELLRMLDDTYEYASGKNHRYLHSTDMPTMVHVANWRAFKHYDDPALSVNVLRPLEFSMQIPELIHGVVRWIVEHQIKGGTVRASFRKENPRYSRLKIEIRTRNEQLIQECMEEWYAKGEKESKEDRAIRPLRRKFGPWFEAGGDPWSGTDLIFLAGH